MKSKLNVLALTFLLTSCNNVAESTAINESTAISEESKEISSESVNTNKVDNDYCLISKDDEITIKKIYKVLYTIDKKDNVEVEGKDLEIDNAVIKLFYNIDKDTYHLKAYPTENYDIDDLFINDKQYKYDALSYVYDKDNPYYQFDLTQEEAIDGLKLRANISRYKDKNYLLEDEELAKKLKGLNYSIMGDSISTFEGYNNNATYNTTLTGNAVYYPCSYSVENQVLEVSDTYWYQIKEDLGFNLCVNNAFSGSHVCQIYSNAQSACIDRCVNLHNDNLGIYPDIITVYIGINDHGEDKELGEFTSRDDIYDADTGKYKTATASKYFKTAYAMMIDKMVNAYPNAKIYVSNLLVSNYHKLSKEVALLNQYGEAIKDIASFYDINFVDMVSYSGITQYNNYKYYEDNMIHPNTLGMDIMAKVFENAIIKDFAYNNK